MNRDKYNLYLIASRTTYPSPPADTVYQQLWRAKRDTRAYHGEHLREYQMKMLWGSEPLPLLVSTESGKSEPGKNEHEGSTGMPWSALTFHKLERRLDVAIFRACLAESVPVAYRAVISGHVKVNARVVKTPSRLLEDGDLVEVHPDAISVLEKPDAETDEAAESNSQDIQPAQCGSSTEAQASNPESRAQSTTSSTSPDSPESKEVQSSPPPPRKFAYLPYAQPLTFIPEYLEVSFALCAFVFLRSPMLHSPTHCEIPSPYPPEVHALAHAFYARRTVVAGTEGHRKWMKQKTRHHKPLYY